MTQSDYPALCQIMQDAETMFAYEHAFSDEEVSKWLAKHLQNYHTYGFGLWAVILKENDLMIGQCGLTMQDCDGTQVLEVGYLFNIAYWHKGYATEAAVACKQYAFDKLEAREVFTIVRDINIASQNVAKRNGMNARKTFVKHYYGIDMPHFLFSVRREDDTRENLT